MRFREKEVVKEKFYAAKNLIKFDKAIRLLVSIMPRMSGYVKTFKVEDKINKLMILCIDDENH